MVYDLSLLLIIFSHVINDVIMLIVVMMVMIVQFHLQRINRYYKYLLNVLNLILLWIWIKHLFSFIIFINKSSLRIVFLELLVLLMHIVLLTWIFHLSLHYIQMLLTEMWKHMLFKRVLVSNMKLEYRFCLENNC